MKTIKIIIVVLVFLVPSIFSLAQKPKIQKPVKYYYYSFSGVLTVEQVVQKKKMRLASREDIQGQIAFCHRNAEMMPENILCLKGKDFIVFTKKTGEIREISPKQNVSEEIYFAFKY